MDDGLRGESFPLLGGLGRARLVPAAYNQPPDGGHIAGESHKQREDPKYRESDGKKHVTGNFPVPCANEAPTPWPLQSVFTDPYDGQQGEDQDQTPDDRQGLFGDTCLHVVGVPVWIGDRQGSLNGHYAGHKKRTETESGHAHTEKRAQVVRRVDVLPLEVRLVSWYDDGTGQKLSKEIGQRQRANTKQKRLFPFIFLLFIR